MGTFTLDGRLGDLIVRGARLKGNLVEAVTAASVSLSTSEVTQLDLAIVDDDRFTLLRSGLFAPGTTHTRGSRLDYRDLRLEVRAVELAARGADHAIRVTARSLGAGNLKRARGAAVRKGLSPTQFAGLEAKAAGLAFVGQPSAERKAVARKTGETSWDVCQRLASELGYLCFEAAGVLHFGRPTWLAEHGKALRVTWRGARTDNALDAVPTCRRTGDNARRLAEVTAQLRGSLGEDARPGMALVLAGVPTFEGRYLVDSVGFSLAEDTAADVTATTPVNPKPEPPAKPAKSSPGPGRSSTADAEADTGRRTARRFVAVALEQAGDRYIYGAEAAATDADPNAFDCSELVQWAAARAGVEFVDGSAAQIAACKPVTVAEAIRTRGALLYHPGHIAISLGNGKTIEAANSRVGVVSYNAAGRFTRGGLIRGLRY